MSGCVFPSQELLGVLALALECQGSLGYFSQGYKQISTEGTLAKYIVLAQKHSHHLTLLSDSLEVCPKSIVLRHHQLHFPQGHSLRLSSLGWTDG